MIFFCDIYTCIHDNPPMNHVKIDGRLIVIVVCSNWQKFKNFDLLDEYLKQQWIFLMRYFTHAYSTIFPWIMWSLVMIKFKMVDLLPLLFAQIDKIFENFDLLDEYLKQQWIFFMRYFTHAYSTIFPWILWSLVMIKFKMVDLLPLLFAQIEQNIWKLCPSWWISQTPINILCKNLPMHILQSFHEFCEVWSWSNSKWSTYCHCDKNISQIGKIFNKLCPSQWISQTAMNFFCDFYTCIHNNPPINPVKFGHDQI